MLKNKTKKTWNRTFSKLVSRIQPTKGISQKFFNVLEVYALRVLEGHGILFDAKYVKKPIFSGHIFRIFFIILWNIRKSWDVKVISC